MTTEYDYLIAQLKAKIAELQSGEIIPYDLVDKSLDTKSLELLQGELEMWERVKEKDDDQAGKEARWYRQQLHNERERLNNHDNNPAMTDRERRYMRWYGKLFGTLSIAIDRQETVIRNFLNIMVWVLISLGTIVLGSVWFIIAPSALYSGAGLTTKLEIYTLILLQGVIADFVIVVVVWFLGLCADSMSKLIEAYQTTRADIARKEKE